MSNRLLINIANAVEWLRDREKDKVFYKGVVKFLEDAARILEPAVENLRGKDIHQTDQVYGKVLHFVQGFNKYIKL